MPTLKKCECGCGRIVNFGKRFICGHNLRVISEDSERKRVGKLTGIKHTKETRRKISEGNKGKAVSEETRRKISKGSKGRIISAETRIRMSEGQKGKIHSEAQKKKMVKFMAGNQYAKGHRHTEETKRKISIFFKGGCLSEEHKKKISLAKLGKYCGPNHPNWKGGMPAEAYCSIWLDKDFKESIRERDEHTCQNPDCWGNCNHLPLNIHHIDYVKKNCAPQNLITVCVSCNSRANGNREYWTNLYQEIMKIKGV